MCSCSAQNSPTMMPFQEGMDNGAMPDFCVLYTAFLNCLPITDVDIFRCTIDRTCRVHDVVHTSPRVRAGCHTSPRARPLPEYMTHHAIKGLHKHDTMPFTIHWALPTDPSIKVQKKKSVVLIVDMPSYLVARHVCRCWLFFTNHIRPGRIQSTFQL